MKKHTAQSNSGEKQIKMNNPPYTDSKKRILPIIFILILILIIGIMAFIIFSFSHNKEKSKEPITKKRDTIVTIDNKNEILADLNNKVAEGLFNVTMNVDWSFENSSTPSENAYVANAVTNTNTVYFDVTIDSTGEKIYESPNIPVGYALKDITLNSELSAGTYTCTVLYHLIDEEENEISNVAVALKIHVLN